MKSMRFALSFTGALVACTCFAQSVPTTAEGRFSALDTNRDGAVSQDEYDSDATFLAIDSDGNNRITASEVEAVLGPQGAGMPSAADRIRVVDMNGDGELTDEELRRGEQTRFLWLDTNDDGSLDLSELKAGFGVPMR